MADVNVTLRRYNGTTWDQLFPKTTVDQINDVSTVGSALIQKANPTANSFLRVNTNATVDYLTAAQLKTAIDAADAVHTHTIANITDLDLSTKADLSSGKIVSSQIPDFLFSGMRFIDTATTGDTLTTLLAEINGSSDAEKKGGYFVVTADFSLAKGTNTALSIAYGDDGDETTAPITVEKGDWIVYAGNSEFAIVNNTYRVATTASKGIVALSAGSNTLRSQLASSSNGLKVMDEKAVKTVMKDIFYQASAPTGTTGDLWFEGTFA